MSLQVGNTQHSLPRTNQSCLPEQVAVKLCTVIGLVKLAWLVLLRSGHSGPGPMPITQGLSRPLSDRKAREVGLEWSAKETC